VIWIATFPNPCLFLIILSPKPAPGTKPINNEQRAMKGARCERFHIMGWKWDFALEDREKK
jgi:hypothetical protein